MSDSRISVVIPTLNEEENIAEAIASAWAAGASEVVVSDAKSTDQTETRARQVGASKFVHSLPGRGTQLNAGAAVADGDVLLFLHADGRLSPNCLHQINNQKDVTWGAFQQRIESPRLVYRIIERGNAGRVSLRKMPFGDQAMYVRRDLFRSVGGFPDEPLMEDVVLSRRLRKLTRPSLLPGPVFVSPRRWENTGIVRQTTRNWLIQFRFALGASPDQLRERYG